MPRAVCSFLCAGFPLTTPRDTTWVKSVHPDVWPTRCRVEERGVGQVDLLLTHQQTLSVVIVLCTSVFVLKYPHNFDCTVYSRLSGCGLFGLQIIRAAFFNVPSI
jgi:hypothetical protein